MAVKTKPAYNVIEQAENVAADAWEKTGKIVKKEAKTIAKDVASQASFAKWLGIPEAPPAEVIRAQEEEDFMRKLAGYKDIFRKIDAIEGRATDENALDEKTRRYVEEERKKAMESFQEMKSELRTEAKNLGTAPQGGQEQEKQQREQAEAEEKEREKEEKQAKLEEDVEAPAGRDNGPGLFKNKRRHNPLRGAPRATLQHRTSPEARAGHGVGG